MPSISASSMAALVRPPCRTEWLNQRPTGLQDLKYLQLGFLQKKFGDPRSRSLIPEFAPSQNVRGFFFFKSTACQAAPYSLDLGSLGRGGALRLCFSNMPKPHPCPQRVLMIQGSGHQAKCARETCLSSPRLSSQDVLELDSESL